MADYETFFFLTVTTAGQSQPELYKSKRLKYRVELQVRKRRRKEQYKLKHSTQLKDKTEKSRKRGVGGSVRRILKPR